MAGVSRSATIVTAYLIAACDLSFYNAMAFVTARRPCANPNFGFRLLLAKYGDKVGISFVLRFTFPEQFRLIFLASVSLKKFRSMSWYSRYYGKIMNSISDEMCTMKKIMSKKIVVIGIYIIYIVSSIALNFL